MIALRYESEQGVGPFLWFSYEILRRRATVDYWNMALYPASRNEEWNRSPFEFEFRSACRDLDQLGYWFDEEMRSWFESEGLRIGIYHITRFAVGSVQIAFERDSSERLAWLSRQEAESWLTARQDAFSSSLEHTLTFAPEARASSFR